PRPPRATLFPYTTLFRSAPRVDDARRAAFLLQEELGVACDAGGKVRRQRERLVEGVGVQRLGVPLRRRHGLDGRARDVVEHVLRDRKSTRLNSSHVKISY